MEKTKLHLGCGNKHLDGFINVDIRNLPEVDIVDDIKTLKSFDLNSIDLIYCSHVLEHFGRREYLNVLKRWYAILKKDGILRVSVPNFKSIVEHYVEHKNLSMLLGLLYGGQNYPENFHYCIWDFENLKNDLLFIGFKNIKEFDWRNTEHGFIDDYSQSYLPHMDKENGKLMSLNIEAIK